jgi:hypothetical protein
MNRRGFVNEKVTEESVASHPDPESCAASREAAIEASTAGTCKARIELRNGCDRGADAVQRRFVGLWHDRGKRKAETSAPGV